MVSAPMDGVRRALLFRVRRRLNLNKFGQPLLDALQVYFIPIDDFFPVPLLSRRSPA